MSNTPFFIGTAVNEQGNAVRAFRDELEAQLWAIPEDRTAQLLDTRLKRDTAMVIWSAQLDGLPATSRMLFDRFVTTAMAKEQLEVYQDKRQYNPWGIGWLEVAQQAANDHYDNGRMPNGVKDDEFFRQKIGIFKQLGMQALARLEPYGEFSRYTFASGIASGAIRIPTPDFSVSTGSEQDF